MSCQIDSIFCAGVQDYVMILMRDLCLVLITLHKYFLMPIFSASFLWMDAYLPESTSCYVQLCSISLFRTI